MHKDDTEALVSLKLSNYSLKRQVIKRQLTLFLIYLCKVLLEMDSGTSYMLNKCSTMELQPGPMVWFLYALLVQRGRTTSPPPGDTFLSLVTSLYPFTWKVHPGSCYAKQPAHAAALVNQQSFRGVVAMGTRTPDFAPHLGPPGATVP